MNLYEIKDILEKKEKAIFTMNEFAKLFQLKKEVASVYLYRMVKKGLLIKIEKNKFSLTNDPFIIASQITFPCYLSLTSALYLHNIMPQIPDIIEVITSRQKKSLYNNLVKIRFIKVKPELMFGYLKLKKESSFIMLADVEKTIIDSLIFLRYCRLQLILDALKIANLKRLEEYLSLIRNEAIVRRVGYLLDLLKIKHHFKKRTDVVYKLNPSIRKRGEFNKKWYLYVNEDANKR